MSTATPVKMRSLLRRWRAGWITVGVVVLILAIVLAGTPWLISHQLQKWVLANGGENVSVEDVDFNPFTAELSLINVAIERGGSQSLLLPELRLKARWRDLFERRFVIESADLNGVQLTFDQSQPEQEHVAGILLKNLVAEEAATPEPRRRPRRNPRMSPGPFS